MSQNIGNFINLSWTLAKRHQCLQCYYHASKNSIIEPETEVGPGENHQYIYFTNINLFLKGGLIPRKDRPPPLHSCESCFKYEGLKDEYHRPVHLCCLTEQIGSK